MNNLIELLADVEIGQKTYGRGSVLEIDSEELRKELLDTGKAKAVEVSEPKPETQPESTPEPDGSDLNTKLSAIIEAAVQKATRPPVVVREAADLDPKGGFQHIGTFLRDVRDSATGKSVSPQMKTWRDKSAKALGQNESVDSDGGFLVPDEFRATLLQKSHQASEIVAKCTKIPVETRSVTLPAVNESARTAGSRNGGVRGYYVAEGAEITASKATFAQVKLEVNKLAALVYITGEMLDDSPMSVEAIINELVAKELAWIMDEKVITGTGAGQPLGILKAPALVTVSKENAQAANTLVVQNIHKMWSRLPVANRGNAVWLVNQELEPLLAQMNQAVGTAGGELVYMPPGGLSAAPYATLKGRPVIVSEHAEALSAKGDIILADFTQYLWAEKSGGIKADSSMHVRFVYDEEAYRFIVRNDGQPWWSSALTPAKGTATLSPFVTLEAR